MTLIVTSWSVDKAPLRQFMCHVVCVKRRWFVAKFISVALLFCPASDWRQPSTEVDEFKIVDRFI